MRLRERRLIRDGACEGRIAGAWSFPTRLSLSLRLSFSPLDSMLFSCSCLSCLLSFSFFVSPTLCSRLYQAFFSFPVFVSGFYSCCSSLSFLSSPLLCSVLQISFSSSFRTLVSHPSFHSPSSSLLFDSSRTESGSAAARLEDSPQIVSACESLYYWYLVGFVLLFSSLCMISTTIAR